MTTQRNIVRLILTIVAASWLLCASIVFAAEETPAAHNSTTLEMVLDNAISRNLISGGVVVVGNREGIIATAARGGMNFNGSAPALSEHTIFDLASLTKVVATAPAVMKLLDEGRVALSDPLSRWFPELGGTSVGNITILNLLTHTSGLSDIHLHSGQGIRDALAKITVQRPNGTAHFHYADINFILLGEMVRRVSGETLDAFCAKEIYGPMAARDTLFLPPAGLAGNIAPTLGFTPGVVQDTNARRLGGVAGHAGLFSSAYDLSLYARMILGGGAINQQRILSEQVVAQMTTPYACSNGSVLRGLGWDIDSPFSAPRGNYFSRMSFGHTGYSGSSMWIDPQQDLFVIFLTNRLEYRNVRAFNQLRRDVSTMAVANARNYHEQAPVDAAAVAADLLQPGSRPILRLASMMVKGPAHSAKKCRQVAHSNSKRDKRLAKASIHRGSRGGKSAGVKMASRKKHSRTRTRA
ncbi:beta-lactamase family protein [Geomonas sp. RF6]|uniref:serine hydrolase domain-containing protein n=1 Tax=Geomonas sp. RF6 TaxID=2897342 RepID=UPI001E318719|nr:serine hydrolase [Geomonas sp. RF6]UFS70759.1 beta-lactamase family protein [Geomonas sp. RF6]